MGDPGLSLFDQKHLTLHLNNDEEEDEAAIRYAKEKDDEIKEELARAFLHVDDDDEDDHEGPSGSSSSDEEEGYQAGNIKDNSTKVHRTNGLIFNSDNSHNLLNESDVSRNTAPERPALANGQMFSPSRRESSGFAQTSGGNMEYLTVNGGRGDGNHHFQTWSNANNFGHREHFEKSLEESVGDYRQVNGGRGDAGEHLQMWNGTNYGQNEQFDNSHGESTGKYSQCLGENEVPERYHQQVFSNNSQNENDKPFKPIFSSDGSKTFDKSDEDYILAYKHTEDNVEQLRVLLDVQERELKRLTEQLETERQQSAKYKNEMFRKCALMEGEKERALLSRDELSKLLISSKEQINMLQTEVQSLKEIIAAMEKNKKKNLFLIRLDANENSDHAGN
ncbi:hypothetical protein J6590_032452 [Homalodisca vitripennis]|nr:hypothetical protein J6590_032452 [Homalodisca vitripennis]